LPFPNLIHNPQSPTGHPACYSLTELTSRDWMSLAAGIYCYCLIDMKIWENKLD
jgi:hypothetical protein